MGYYADCSGTIKFGRTLSREEMLEAYNILENAFEFIEFDKNAQNNKQNSVCDVHVYDKYYEDTYYETFTTLMTSFPVAECNVEFAGEDYTFWRYRIVDGALVVEDGRVIYESDFDIYKRIHHGLLISDADFFLRYYCELEEIDEKDVFKDCEDAPKDPVTLEQLCDKESQYYVLEYMVDVFETIQDSNAAENDQWYECAHRVFC